MWRLLTVLICYQSCFLVTGSYETDLLNLNELSTNTPIECCITLKTQTTKH